MALLGRRFRVSGPIRAWPDQAGLAAKIDAAGWRKVAWSAPVAVTPTTQPVPSCPAAPFTTQTHARGGARSRQPQPHWPRSPSPPPPR